jgi:hypothetical protein
MISKAIPSLIASMAMIYSQCAKAEDSLFQGSCDRARIVQQQTTIDKIMVFGRYEGIQRMHTGQTEKKECKADQILVDTLTLKSRNNVEAIFDVKTTVMTFGSVPNCMEPKIMNTDRYGTVKFTTKLSQANEICDLYVWSEWSELSKRDPNWSAGWSTRVVKLSDNGLVIAQTTGNPGQFYSPIAYAGVQQ